MEVPPLQLLQDPEGKEYTLVPLPTPNLAFRRFTNDTPLLLRYLTFEVTCAGDRGRTVQSMVDTMFLPCIAYWAYLDRQLRTALPTEHQRRRHFMDNDMGQNVARHAQPFLSKDNVPQGRSSIQELHIPYQVLPIEDHSPSDRDTLVHLVRDGVVSLHESTKMVIYCKLNQDEDQDEFRIVSLGFLKSLAIWYNSFPADYIIDLVFLVPASTQRDLGGILLHHVLPWPGNEDLAAVWRFLDNGVPVADSSQGRLNVMTEVPE